MITVRPILKPKNGATAQGGGGTSTVSTNVAEAEHAARADRADKADKADIAEQANKATYANSSGYATTAGELDEDGETFQKFIRKDIDDEAAGLVTFDKGIAVGTDKAHGIGADGAATLSTVTVERAHDAQSDESKRVIVGAQGFDLYMGADGRSHLWVDNLSVRTRAFFSQLEIRKVSYSGGTTLFSNAGSTIAKVAALELDGRTVAYKCYCVADDGETQTMNWWKVGDMALSQTFNVKGATASDTGNRYYWRLVVDTGQETLEDGKLYDYVTLSNMRRISQDTVIPVTSVLCAKDGDSGSVLPLEWVDTVLTVERGMDLYEILEAQGDDGTTDDDGGIFDHGELYGYDPNVKNDAPQAGDVIVQAGNMVHWNTRGNIIRLATSTEDGTTDNAPSIMMYHGMGQPTGTNYGYSWETLTAVISPQEVSFNAKYFRWFTSADGSGGKTIDEMMSEQRTAIDKDIDGVRDSVTTVSNKTAELSASIDGITSRVTATETTTKTIQSDLTTANEAISKNASDLSAYETKTDAAISDANAAIDDANAAIKENAANLETAKVTIKKDYESAIEQSATSINLSVTTQITETKEYADGQVETLKSGIERTGIDIDAGQITLTADTTVVMNNAGEQVAIFNSDGSLAAGALETTDVGEGHVKISGGLLQVFAPFATSPSIKFGMKDGYMMMTYYDTAGNALYDLGPDGILNVDIKKASVTETAAQLIGTSLFSHMYLWYNSTGSYAWTSTKPTSGTYDEYDMASADLEQIILKENYTGVGTAKTLMLYSAPRTNGTIVADSDSTRALTTYALAKSADGKTFLATPFASGSSLTNLASGYMLLHVRQYNGNLNPEYIWGDSDLHVVPKYFVTVRQYTNGVLTATHTIASQTVVRIGGTSSASLNALSEDDIAVATLDEPQGQ